MERIEREYAIIYIDHDGETLKKGIDNFTPNEIINDYYNHPGFLQWNYYLIIPKELIKSKEKIQEIEEDEIYTLKIIVNREKISEFLNEIFPEIKKEQPIGEIIIVKGKNHSNSVKLTEEIRDKKAQEGLYYEIIPSLYRNYSSFQTLKTMDKMRAQLIKYPSTKQIYYTHISNEYSWAEKKFKLFINKKLEKEKKS